LFKLFLLEANVSKAPPCVVMTFIARKRFLVALLCLIEVFIGYVFMSAESMSICEMAVQLNSTVEKLKGSFMFFLERVTVANHTPSLRGEQGFLKGVV